MNAIARIFVGEDRRLRHVWRAAIFFALVTFCLPLGDGASWPNGRSTSFT